MRIAVADIGGTKTLLTLYEGEDGAWREVSRRRFDSAAHPAVDPILGAFLEEIGAVDGLGIGIAGPVEGRHCKATNLPWAVNADALEASLGVPVALVNDFVALALGIGEVPDDKLIVLQDGEVDPEGPVGIVGAGTGLGMAVVLPSGRVLPSEGGHADFAPRNDREIALLKHLQKKLGRRISIERVLSGPGIANLYGFLDQGEEGPPADADPAAWIHEASRVGGNPDATTAIEMFVEIYGAVAGNFALTTLPTGGLFLAGGIAPKMRNELDSDRFREAYLAKGRLSRVLQDFRVCILDEPATPLLGARRAARAWMERG